MYCAVKIKKIKSGGVGHIEEHNKRTVEQRHTDSSKTHLNKWLMTAGYNSLSEAVNDKIATLATQQKRKVRKDAAVLVDMVLIASPEYFREDKSKWGEYDQDRLVEYSKASLDFLKKKYGDRLIAVALHLDEATPHIHASIVPVTEDGRLSGKDMFDKAQLSMLQTEYAEAMQHLGLKRGIKGKQEQKDSSDYYKQLSKAQSTISSLTSIIVSTAKATLHNISQFVSSNPLLAKPTTSHTSFDNQFSPIFPENLDPTKLDITNKVDPKHFATESTKNAVKNDLKIG
jgi:hypothetical protein